MLCERLNFPSCWRVLGVLKHFTSIPFGERTGGLWLWIAGEGYRRF